MRIIRFLLFFYYNNDVNKVVHLDIVEQEYILKCADAER